MSYTHTSLEKLIWGEMLAIKKVIFITDRFH